MRSFTIPPTLVKQHSVDSRIRFVNATLHEMAQSELMEMINPAMLTAIKAHDSNPKFRAYVVGHEGESSGRISVDNVTWIKVVKKWFTSAIRNLHDKVILGTQLFHGHSTEAARTSIGEVVGKKLADIGDRLSVIVATYIKPEFKNLPLDVASIEADIDLHEDNAGEYVADVANVHAIALGNKSVEQPGFKGAQLVTQLFEFAEHGKYQIHEGDKNLEITVDDIKRVIKSESIKPSDIFSASDLTDDPSVKGIVESETKSATAGEYAHRKRHEDASKGAKEKLEKEVEDLKKENTSLKSTVAKSEVDGLFVTAKKDRNFSDKQSKFIESKNKDFDPSGDPDKLKDEYSKFLDDKVVEFKQISKDIFGEEVKDTDTKKNDDEHSEEKDSVTGASKEETDTVDDNPFID